MRRRAGRKLYRIILGIAVIMLSLLACRRADAGTDILVPVNEDVSQTQPAPSGSDTVGEVQEPDNSQTEEADATPSTDVRAYRRIDEELIRTCFEEVRPDFIEAYMLGSKVLFLYAEVSEEKTGGQESTGQKAAGQEAPEGGSPELGMCLTDLETGEIRRASLSELNPYAFAYRPIGDAAFALFDEEDGRSLIYDSELNLLRELAPIPGGKTFCKDICIDPACRFLYYFDSRDNALIRQALDGDEREVLYTEDLRMMASVDMNYQATGWLNFVIYDFFEDSYRTLVFDTETGERVAEEEGYLTLIPLEDEFLRVAYNPIAKVEVCKGRPGLGDKVCTIDLDNESESENLYIDAEAGVLVTTTLLKGPEAASYYEIRAYSLEDGSLLGQRVYELTDLTYLPALVLDRYNREVLLVGTCEGSPRLGSLSYAGQGGDAVGVGAGLACLEDVGAETGLAGGAEAGAEVGLAGLVEEEAESGLAGLVEAGAETQGLPEREISWQSRSPEEVYVKYEADRSFSEELAGLRADLEARYGINIYLGAEIEVGSFEYDLSPVEDEGALFTALKKLEEVLSIYPQGFFDELKCEKGRSLGIYLSGRLISKAEDKVSNAVAVAATTGYERSLALDITAKENLKRTLVHEISHWIDKKLVNAERREKRLFESDLGTEGQRYETFEDYWKSLNPEDFAYTESYVAERKFSQYVFDTAREPDQAYFIDSYSQTYAIEDRARLIEYYFYDGQERGYLTSGPIRTKLRAYFEAICGAFETDGMADIFFLH